MNNKKRILNPSEFFLPTKNKKAQRERHVNIAYYLLQFMGHLQELLQGKYGET